MTRYEAIRKATKIGFEKGASVRFGLDGAIYSVLDGKILFAASNIGSDGSLLRVYTERPAKVGTELRAELKPLPAMEPEKASEGEDD